MDKSTNEEKIIPQGLIDECQTYHYAQSSKVSELSRKLIFGVMAMVWLVSYNNTVFAVDNTCLFISLGLSFFYLFVEILHYFWDACSYRQQYFHIDSGAKDYKARIEHKTIMNGYSKRSFGMLCAKMFLLLITSTLFIIGFIQKVL